MSSKKSIGFGYKLLNSFPFNFFFGIGGLIYILHGVILGNRWVKKYGIQFIYSSYFPYSDHYMAYFLKLLNPSIFWIADFRDLHYTGKKGEYFWPGLQYWINKKVLKKADQVTTVSEGLKEKLLSFNVRCLSIRNSYGSLNKAFSSEFNKRTQTQKFIISYTGNLIPGQRDPSLLFEVLRKLQVEDQSIYRSIELCYIGNTPALWQSYIEKYRLSDISSVKGFLPLKKSFEIQSHAQINLLLSSSNFHQKGILTGKFYEYIYARNPILLLLLGENDEEFERIFNELNCGQIFYIQKDDPSRLKAFLLELYQKWKIKDFPLIHYNEKAFLNHDMAYQMKPLMENLLDSHQAVSPF